jgi:YrbI family 3-deoxy-D-manno-octulosonate 8-phosphate phosphatase
MSTHKVFAPKIVALIPLRGGSKRIPGKNIKPLLGKPLAYWACAAAAHCPRIREVYVSTEDEQIRAVVESFGLNVRVLARPPALAADTATTDDVILHFAAAVDFDIVATVQATSPLVSSSDLDLALTQMLRDGNDSLLTGVPVKRFFWSPDARPLNYDPLRRPFSQNFKGSIMENGAFYLTTRATLDKHRNRLGGKIGIFEMPPDTAVEIDDPEDWETVEKLLSHKVSYLARRAKQVKLILSDFDGVWTDNKVYTFGNSDEGIASSKADSLALGIFRQRFAIPVIVVSKEKNPVVQSRCAKLHLEALCSVEDKLCLLDRELAARGLSWSEVCYIGNDLNDLECMRKAGLTFCPADAAPEIRGQANYVLSHTGGNGAVREMLELLSKEL